MNILLKILNWILVFLRKFTPKEEQVDNFSASELKKQINKYFNKSINIAMDCNLDETQLEHVVSMIKTNKDDKEVKEYLMKISPDIFAKSRNVWLDGLHSIRYQKTKLTKEEFLEVRLLEYMLLNTWGIQTQLQLENLRDLCYIMAYTDQTIVN